MTSALGDWSNYFIAQAGASAALAGLLFVALSINIEHILKSPWLPPRAAATMVLLVGSLVEALVALWPHETLVVIGAEELVASVVVWAFVLRLMVAGAPPKEYAAPTRLGNAIAQLATLPAIGGAVAIVAFGATGGTYAIAFAMLMAIVVAFLNSWVLLVEILR